MVNTGWRGSHKWLLSKNQQRLKINNRDDKNHIWEMDYILNVVLRASSADLTQFSEQRTEISPHVPLLFSKHTESDSPTW